MVKEYRHLTHDPSTSSVPHYESDSLPPLGITGVVFPGAVYFAATQAAYYCVHPRTRFARLAQEWHEATAHFSSSTDIAMHPNYQMIIGMGPTALPFILEDLREHGGQWFWALRSIAEQSPVAHEAAGNIPLMKGAWLRWGMERGYLLPE